jgi:hypothetical protein
MFCSCILLFPFQPRQLVARREEVKKKKGKKKEHSCSFKSTRDPPVASHACKVPLRRRS